MDPAVAAAVFAIIFVGELPDKTMFASLVMATRGRPLLVWIGSAAAFLIHVVIAVTVGVVLFHALPPKAVSGMVAGIFLLGAGYSLYQSRRRRVNAEAVRDERVGREAEQPHHRTVLTAFLVIFLAEWGDLTQILMANLAVRYHSPLAVALGSLLALWAVAGLAVIGGRGLLRFVDITVARKLTAAVLLVLAGVEAYAAIA